MKDILFRVAIVIAILVIIITTAGMNELGLKILVLITSCVVIFRFAQGWRGAWKAILRK